MEMTENGEGNEGECGPTGSLAQTSWKIKI